nr:glycosyltransferase family 2 protein [uncultured Pedobacter sp.]
MEVRPVSLIITHFRQYELLKKLLTYLSLNNWAYACDVIIIDDYSLNDVEVEHLSISFPIVKILQTSINSGPSYARNLGARHAEGTYLQFLDADDWISPNKIVLQYAAAQQHNFPAFICSDWARVDYKSTPDDLIELKKYSPLLKEPLPIYLIAGNNFIPLMSGLILKSAFESINGFDENMRLIEDVNLNIRLYQLNPHYRFLKSENPLFFYRSNNPLSLSSNNSIDFNRGVLINYFAVKTSIEIPEQYKVILVEMLWNIYKKAILTKDKPTLTTALIELKKYPFQKDFNERSYNYAAKLNYILFPFFYFYINTFLINTKFVIKKYMPNLFDQLKRLKA